MPRYEGYADPGFTKELSKVPPRDARSILASLATLAQEPYSNPNSRMIEGSRWPGSIRVRCGAYRVLALVLPGPRLILFTTVFRKKRDTDYAAAIRRHDARVAEQGPPLDEFISRRLR
jgi:mRNA-degrading endonuclease RelE of RelBE toxin-antitoxin system